MSFAEVLITGFGPFRGAERNPSGEIAASLHGARIGGAAITGITLPVARDEAFPPLESYLATATPAVIVALGVALTRAVIGVERVAINIDDFSQADERGAAPRDVAIVTGGQDGLISPIPPRALAAAIRSVGTPAEVSNTAGSFLCNHIYYRLLLHARESSPERRPLVTFLHLPQAPEERARTGSSGPSMSYETSERGVLAAITFLLQLATRKTLTGGATTPHVGL